MLFSTTLSKIVAIHHSEEGSHQDVISLNKQKENPTRADIRALGLYYTLLPLLVEFGCSR